MGTSCEANGQNIDSTAGGLVWVRRRNGSWWPGRILGDDELPESCLVSYRRSGTPVKLLGREDASVDWYNLEKSKRVKAFRCGEYDECIEKAKNTTSISCKKAVKYARRDDAILHALELENSQLSKGNNPETTSQTDKTKNMSDKLSGLDFISVAPQELSGTVASVDNSSEGIRRQTLNDSEDDGTEGSKKRMRGLHDLGVGRAISSFKKKRSRVVHDRDILKKKNRRRQLTKVLKKTEMVTIPVTVRQFAQVPPPAGTLAHEAMQMGVPPVRQRVLFRSERPQGMHPLREPRPVPVTLEEILLRIDRQDRAIRDLMTHQGMEIPGYFRDPPEAEDPQADQAADD